MPVRILHVGLGMRGRDWLEYVDAFPETVSAGCVEPDAGALEQARERTGAPAFASLEEALGNVEADAALIASPSPLHADQALAVLGAGLAAMIEKPFAPDVESARRVIARGEELGRPVMVAENFRFVPAERTVRVLVRGGALGRIRNVSLADRRRMPPDMHGGFARELPHPQLTEIAVHHFDSLRSFLGTDPVAVAARTFNPRGSGYAGGACTEALLEFEDQVHAQYLGTMTSNRFSYRLWIEGEQADLWTDRKRVLVRKKGGRLFLPVRKAAVLPGDGAPYPREGTTSLLESLRAAVQDGAQPETHGRENLWAVAMVQAALVSRAEGRTVPIAEVCPA